MNGAYASKKLRECGDISLAGDTTRDSPRYSAAGRRLPQVSSAAAPLRDATTQFRGRLLRRRVINGAAARRPAARFATRAAYLSWRHAASKRRDAGTIFITHIWH